MNLTYSPAAAFNVSGAPTYRPNLIGDVHAPEGQRTYLNYFNAANVVIPADSSQPFGNAPRNAARGPRIHTLDMGVHKGFTLANSQARLELRLEAFNVLNRTNFSTPNGNRSSTSFGAISSLATPPRQLQLGVKVDF